MLRRGEKIRQYEINDILGNGSCGQVYSCTTDGNAYAIKCIRRNNLTAKNEKSIAQILKLEEDRFLVKVIENFVEGEMIYIVMELCGKNFESLIVEKTFFSSNDLMKVIIQILLGLFSLHKRNILHRDLNPKNVFLSLNSSNYDLKIGDFGCGKILTTQNTTNSMIGTLAYNAPEVVQGFQYDGKADVWSLGVMMYQMVTFTLPFEGNIITLPMKIADGEYKKIDTEYTIDENLKSIIYSMLIANPIHRPSVLDLLNNSTIISYATKLRLVHFFPSALFSLSSSSSSSDSASSSSSTSSYSSAVSSPSSSASSFSSGSASSSSSGFSSSSSSSFPVSLPLAAGPYHDHAPSPAVRHLTRPRPHRRQDLSLHPSLLTPALNDGDDDEDSSSPSMTLEKAGRCTPRSPHSYSMSHIPSPSATNTNHSPYLPHPPLNGARRHPAPPLSLKPTPTCTTPTCRATSPSPHTPPTPRLPLMPHSSPALTGLMGADSYLVSSSFLSTDMLICASVLHVFV